MKAFFIKHVIPFALACCIVTGLYNSSIYDHRFNIIETYEESGMAYPVGFISNFVRQKTRESVILNLTSNHLILMMGSSELTGSDSLGYRPKNFIQKVSNMGVLDLGHEGNQEFSMFTQLLQFKKFLKKAKITFIISPGWFAEDYAAGTSVNSFLEYNNEAALEHIHFSEDIPKKFKAAVYQYLNKNYTEINAPTTLMSLMAYSDQSSTVKSPVYYPINRLLKKTYQTKNKLFVNTNQLYDISNCGYEMIAPPTISVKEFDWENESNRLKEKFEGYYSNDWGITDDYYDQWIKGETKYLKITPAKLNQELKDFHLMLDAIQHYEVDASFIIQGLNPYYYENLEELDPIVHEITNALDEHNYPYLNLHTSQPEEFEIGTLNDVMHMGDLGWLKVNQFLIDTYGKDQ